jgi:predicted transcriptional regulator
MAAIGSELTRAEFIILSKLWGRGLATAADLTEDAYGTQTVSHYYTVLKLLDNLRKKNYVGRDTSRRQHVFHAARSKAAVVAEVMGSIRENMTFDAPDVETEANQKDELLGLIEAMVEIARGVGGKRALEMLAAGAAKAPAAPQAKTPVAAPRKKAVASELTTPESKRTRKHG